MRKIPCMAATVSALLVLTFSYTAIGQDGAGPSDPKAQKTFKTAAELQEKQAFRMALEYFKKADKQDGGHCVACQLKMFEIGLRLNDWKTAEGAVTELAAGAKDDRTKAIAHYEAGVVKMREGMAQGKDDLFSQAHDEYSKALGIVPNFPGALYGDGIALGHMNQDDAAKARFEEFVKLKQEGDTDRQRAMRYIANPELVRARMAPAFAITTADGKRLTLDDLKGKVVLIDFWATWCPSCREAVPHIRKIARTFSGEPFVVLSISLDSDEQKWKDFVDKNEMTWIQYRDGDFSGPIASLFSVHAIPQTFTIDADGVLQDQHIGNASIEGNLKKLIAQANEMQTSKIASR